MSRSYSNHPPPRDSYRDPPPPPPSHRRDDPRSWTPSQPPQPQQQYQQHPQQYQNYQQPSYSQPPPSQQYQQQPYHPLQGFTQPPPPPSSSSRYLPPPFPSSSSWQPQDRRDVASNGYGYQPPQQNWRDAPPPPPPQQSYGRTNGFGGGGRDHREEQAPPPRHMRWDGDGRVDDDRRSSSYDRDSWGGGGGERYRGGGGEREREYRRDDRPSRDPYQQPSQYDRGPPGLPSRPPQPYQHPSQSYQHPHSSQQQYSNSDHRQHQQNQSQGGGGGSGTRSRSPTRRPTKPPGPKRRTTPTPEYEALSLQPSSRIGPNPPKKLLLLDLNGTLIYRARASSQMSYRKRPYLDALMSYLKEKWEVGVWSSATPENVERMLLFLGMKAGQQEIAQVEESSEKGKKKDEMVLRVVWARDTLGLSDGEYNSKTITIKNLDVIFAYLNSPESRPPPKQDRFPRASSKTRVYSPLNTFLLDDSHIKTSCQPYNHLPVPDYDSVLSVASARFFRAAEQQKDAPPPSLPNPDEIKMSDDDDDEMKAATPPPAGEPVKEVESVGVDRSLLAVVGILERARGEESLIGWVRSGGLIPDLDDPNGWWLVDDTPKTSTSTKPPASDSASTSDPTANGNIKRSRRPKVKKAKKTQIDATNLSAIFPPSTSSSTNPVSSSSTPLEVSSTTPWYSSPPHVEFWVRRGVDVLSGMGVDLSHGVDLAFLDSMEPKGSGRSSLRSSRNRAPKEEEEGKGIKVGGEGEEDEEMKVERELLGDSSF